MEYVENSRAGRNQGDVEKFQLESYFFLYDIAPIPIEFSKAQKRNVIWAELNRQDDR